MYAQAPLEGPASRFTVVTSVKRRRDAVRTVGLINLLTGECNDPRDINQNASCIYSKLVHVVIRRLSSCDSRIPILLLPNRIIVVIL